MPPLSRSFVAPGKIVLFGEYAVLDGMPAIVAAIDRGVRCHYTPDRTLTVQSVHGDQFVLAALKAAEIHSGWFTFSQWNPIKSTDKIGLGHSAAATVCALFAARTLSKGHIQPADLFNLSYMAHRETQGSGSGVDIAASVYGGVQKYHEREVSRCALKRAPVIIWSGQSAKTGPFVERYLELDQRNAFLGASREVVEVFKQDPIAATELALTALTKMSQRADIPYLTPALKQIIQLARDFGGAAKPSGAGGGDCAIAFFPRVSAERPFISACKKAGFQVVPAKIAPGVHEEHHDQP